MRGSFCQHHYGGDEDRSGGACDSSSPPPPRRCPRYAGDFELKSVHGVFSLPGAAARHWHRTPLRSSPAPPPPMKPEGSEVEAAAGAAPVYAVNAFVALSDVPSPRGPEYLLESHRQTDGAVRRLAAPPPPLDDLLLLLLLLLLLPGESTRRYRPLPSSGLRDRSSSWTTERCIEVAQPTAPSPRTIQRGGGGGGGGGGRGRRRRSSG